jgi:hypothetical protein
MLLIDVVEYNNEMVGCYSLLRFWFLCVGFGISVDVFVREASLSISRAIDVGRMISSDCGIICHFCKNHFCNKQWTNHSGPITSDEKINDNSLELDV